MNYAALKTRIADMTGTDAEIAATINGQSETVQGDISIASALAWCAVNEIIVTLDTLSKTAGPLQNVAYATMLMFNSLDSTFALTSPQIQGLIGALVQGGVINETQAADLNAQGQKQVPVRQLLGWTNLISEGDIQTARDF